MDAVSNAIYWRWGYGCRIIYCYRPNEDEFMDDVSKGPFTNTCWVGLMQKKKQKQKQKQKQKKTNHRENF